ncbi:histamine H2 receptor-like [Orbicella faveolata]|uniref:histamine H2 receptor-like n=1 Tax=Orbicella faveolata TaxID=48498 RepID=UPI0009E276C5|nr:histamine H2 receptor-like [Orbicella faveolata]
MLLSSQEASAFAGVLFLIFIFGLVGNVLVCLAIYSDRDLRQQYSNYFLFNLAVTDLLTVTFVIPFCAAALIQEDWNFGVAWCQITAFVYYSLAIVGLESLAFISWDRFYAIIHPLKYRADVTLKKICTAIAFSWFWAVIFTIPCAVLGWFRYGQYESMLRHQGRRVDTITSAETPKTSRRHAWRNYYRFKGFRTITLVIVLFILSWTPFSVTRLIKTVTWNHEIIPASVDTFATVLSLLSTAANPVAYSLFRKDFRRAFKRLFRQACFCSNKLRRDQTELE